ncbi:MAG TPA: LysE family transporter [Rhizomicrobium sp.]|jgi:threonine/homoserine/homoserine lactone efflux protein
MNYFVLLISGFVIGLIAAVPVGPVNLLCVRRTFAHGSLYGFLSGLGAALADVVFAAIVGFGFTWLAQLIKSYFTPIEVIGAAMLLFFGARTFLAPPQLRLDEKLKAKEVVDGATLARAMLSTFLLAITNPGTLFAFTAMFAVVAGLVQGQATFFGAAMMVAGVAAGSTSWWFTLTTIAGLFHARIDERIMTLINRISGAVITVFGLVVFGHLIWRLM